MPANSGRRSSSRGSGKHLTSSTTPLHSRPSHLLRAWLRPAPVSPAAHETCTGGRSESPLSASSTTPADSSPTKSLVLHIVRVDAIRATLWRHPGSRTSQRRLNARLIHRLTQLARADSRGAFKRQSQQDCLTSSVAAREEPYMLTIWSVSPQYVKGREHVHQRERKERRAKETRRRQHLPPRESWQASLQREEEACDYNYFLLRVPWGHLEASSVTHKTTATDTVSEPAKKAPRRTVCAEQRADTERVCDGPGPEQPG